MRSEQRYNKKEDLGRQSIGMDRAESGTSSLAKPTSRISGEADMSAIDQMKKGFLSFTTSLEEGLASFKASLLGQVRKMSAKDEKEASEADLQTAKMQVEAADAAEDTKKRLGVK